MVGNGRDLLALVSTERTDQSGRSVDGLASPPRSAVARLAESSGSVSIAEGQAGTVQEQPSRALGHTVGVRQRRLCVAAPGASVAGKQAVRVHVVPAVEMQCLRPLRALCDEASLMATRQDASFCVL